MYLCRQRRLDAFFAEDLNNRGLKLVEAGLYLNIQGDRFVPGRLQFVVGARHGVDAHVPTRELELVNRNPAARLGVQSKDVLGSVVIAPSLPPGIPGGKYYGYAGNDNTRMVELDVEHPTGRCAPDALDTAWGMLRSYRTRARLEGATYCSVLGDPQCAARCGGEHRVGTDVAEAEDEADGPQESETPK